VYLYSALFVVPHTQGAQASITHCYLQLHQCLPLPIGRCDHAKKNYNELVVLPL